MPTDIDPALLLLLDEEEGNGPAPAPPPATIDPALLLLLDAEDDAPDVDIRQALVAFLRADARLAALVGGRINATGQGLLRDAADASRPVPPQVTYLVVDDSVSRDLRGPTGLGRARVQLDCWAGSIADAAAAARRLRDLLAGYRGPFGGLVLTSGRHGDTRDLHETDPAGSDAGVYRISSDFFLRYRNPS